MGRNKRHLRVSQGAGALGAVGSVLAIELGYVSELSIGTFVLAVPAVLAVATAVVFWWKWVVS